ncbi:MAG TPA: ABC transporter ATP-binding protein, partial [Acidimicrobiales bacterium]|nr:ABC transporter ATP-binding protein [Acidimicrobiales bacterium]
MSAPTAEPATGASSVGGTEVGDGDGVVLRVEDVSVSFGGIRALHMVSLAAGAGGVTGLIGPNGAGKTTLFNVITGLEKPAQGRVRLGGADLSGMAPHRRARLGMARTFQRLEVFGSLSVRDNILTGAEFHRSWSRHAEDPASVTEEILDRVGLRAVAHLRVDAIPTGMARLVELGRALATRPRLLLLDEPGSGLDENESEDLGRLLIELGEAGVAVLLVEHDVDLVMRISRTVFVLDFGRIIASGSPSEVQADPHVRA